MEDIKLDFEDYKTILSHKGKIIGIVDSCNITEFCECLDESIQDSLSKAKGIFINFKINKNQTLFVINDFMAKIHDFVNENAEIIFSTEQLNDIEKNILNYEIIITGL